MFDTIILQITKIEDGKCIKGDERLKTINDVIDPNTTSYVQVPYQTNNDCVQLGTTPEYQVRKILLPIIAKLPGVFCHP